MKNSIKHQSLYDYLLDKTSGNLTKHSINYQLSKLSSDTQIYAKGLTISGCLVASAEPVETSNDILLAGTAKHFINEDIQLKINNLMGVDDDSISFNQFSDLNNDKYYCSDESGMFLESINVKIYSLTICTYQDIQSQRADKVADFFNRHRKKLGCSGLIKPDTILGGKITTLEEVFNGKTTSYVFNRI